MFDSVITFFITKLAGLWLFNKLYEINYWYLMEFMIVRLLELSFIIFEIYLLCVTIENERITMLKIIFILVDILDHSVNLLHVYSQFSKRNLWKLLMLFKARKTKVSDFVLIYNFLLVIIGSADVLVDLSDYSSNDLILYIVDNHDEIFNEQLFQLTVERVLLGNQDDDLWFYVSRKRNVKFTAAGFFNLGYPLITSIISSTITLVAVLVQFTF
ncbi:uncharacterized protein isoform X4 [Rhodnius prolixus]|uniref:uncharacterized protein isoform X4 n=1 Tax=Rhodnius prolixus TaxID=13249 RepID=UPI003D18CF3E